MIGDQAWRKRLNSDRKGIWSLQYPLGRFFDVEHLAKSSPPGVQTTIIDVVRESAGTELRDGDHLRPISAFSEIIERGAKDAVSHGRQAIRILLRDFHDMRVPDQCALIKSARRRQESETMVSCQFVLCGTWSYFTFRSAYREIHGHTSSPPLHSNNVVQITPLCADDALNLLGEKRLMGVYPSVIERVAAEFLVEQTAGDELLIREAVAHLGELEGSWSSNVEQVLAGLTESPVVTDAIERRIRCLAGSSIGELTKLLRVQRLIRDVDCVDTEQLWLAGLVQARDLGGARQCVQMAGPVVNTVVRRLFEIEHPGAVVVPDYLCFEREAISSAAYRRIAEIENLLRNVVVSQWYADDGHDWFQRLGQVKTVAWISDEGVDLGELVNASVLSAFSALGLTPENSSNDPRVVPGRASQRAQESLLESARDWQRRQHEHHGVELAGDNLMHFLTTEALVNVLENKRSGLHGEGKLFRREPLVAALEEYRAIRSAVAHNQPLKLNTISRLEDLHRKFGEWLTVFADHIDTAAHRTPPDK